MCSNWSEFGWSYEHCTFRAQKIKTWDATTHSINRNIRSIYELFIMCSVESEIKQKGLLTNLLIVLSQCTSNLRSTRLSIVPFPLVTHIQYPTYCYIVRGSVNHTIQFTYIFQFRTGLQVELGCLDSGAVQTIRKLLSQKLWSKVIKWRPTNCETRLSTKLHRKNCSQKIKRLYDQEKRSALALMSALSY